MINPINSTKFENLVEDIAAGVFILIMGLSLLIVCIKYNSRCLFRTILLSPRSRENSNHSESFLNKQNRILDEEIQKVNDSDEVDELPSYNEVVK